MTLGVEPQHRIALCSTAYKAVALLIELLGQSVNQRLRRRRIRRVPLSLLTSIFAIKRDDTAPFQIHVRRQRTGVYTGTPDSYHAVSVTVRCVIRWSNDRIRTPRARFTRYVPTNNRLFQAYGEPTVCQCGQTHMRHIACFLAVPHGGHSTNRTWKRF